MLPRTALFSSLAIAVVSLAACASPSGDIANESSSELVAAVVPAHFTCTGANLIPLDVVTTRTRVKVSVDHSDITASAPLRADGHAALGGFLSEDHGTFSIKLDAKMLHGQPGNAILTDEEPGDGPSDDTYTCKLATANDVAMCRAGALASGHLQPGKKGGPDSRDVVVCDAGYSLCRIDPKGSDNDVCGDADDCFACSR
jgi:hypothetical protein